MNCDLIQLLTVVLKSVEGLCQSMYCKEGMAYIISSCPSVLSRRGIPYNSDERLSMGAIINGRIYIIHLFMANTKNGFIFFGIL